MFNITQFARVISPDPKINITSSSVDFLYLYTLFDIMSLHCCFLGPLKYYIRSI